MKMFGKSTEDEAYTFEMFGDSTKDVIIDIVKNPELLLDKEILPYYNYKIDNAMTINDRPQYVVKFTPQVIQNYPLYTGTFYIDQETLAFTRAEFAMDMRDKDKVTNVILRRKPAGLRFSPDEVSYIVSYIYQDDKSYLHYLNNKIRFKCDWKRRLFATNYTVISELVITDNQKENPERIAIKDSFSNNKSLSEQAMSYYDSNFWGAYNIIEPTESLESAVSKLKREE